MNNLITMLMHNAVTSNINNKHASVIFTGFHKSICFGVNNALVKNDTYHTVHAEEDVINKLPHKITRLLKYNVL